MLLKLTPREQYALFCHINPQPVRDRREQRQSNELWTALHLDEVSDAVEAGKVNPKDWPAVGAVTELTLSESSRAYLRELLERPIVATWISRLIGPLYDDLAPE